MPLWRRTPKRGMTRGRHRYLWVTLNVEDLNRLSPGATVDLAALREAGLVRGIARGWKLLGQGDLKVSGLTVKADRVSVEARRKLEAAGGKAEVIHPAPVKKPRPVPKPAEPAAPKAEKPPKPPAAPKKPAAGGEAPPKA